MIKPLSKGLGYVYRQGDLKQIQWKNKNVTIFENDKFIEKIYSDTRTGKVIKKIFQWFNERIKF